MPGEHGTGWTTEHPQLSLYTATDPAAARPGERIVQTANVTNTGDAALFGAVVTLDSGPCREVLGLLEPSRTKSVSCTGTAPADGRVTARVLGMTHIGTVAAADTAAQVAEPAERPSVSAERPSISAEILAAQQDSVSVRVRNTSSVPLLDVVVTGEPAACRRALGTLEPGRSVTYTCTARPGEKVRLAVSARSPTGEVAAAHTRTTLAPPPIATQAPTAQPAPPVPEPARTKLADSGGPLESPAQTAGFIAILGVLVMMVSVGALSSATRAGK